LKYSYCRVRKEGFITTLEYALLALLARQASSGYDLARRLKRPIGFFWSAHQSHIYSELTRLEDEGLIAHQVIEQSNRPDKKLFRLTDAGLAVLRDWVTTPVTPAPPHNELVLRAYAIWLADPPAAIELFRQQQASHASRLAEYEQMLASLLQREEDAAWEVNRPAFGNYATLHAGIEYERAAVAWCSWMVEQFERHQVS
jgi:DNA-binding PadR family transcriptional regulator